LNLSSDDFLVSTFAFEFSLYRYSTGKVRGGKISEYLLGIVEAPPEVGLYKL
jgi:hypothetical protein